MLPGDFTIRGDQTGRIWHAHIARQLPLAGSGERRKGKGVDAEDVLLYALPKEEMYADDLARAGVAIAFAHRPEIRASPVICKLVDTNDNEYALTLIWEWADVSLNDVLRSITDEDAAQIETNMRAALATMHALDLVHCDVAPNNVLRVGGTRSRTTATRTPSPAPRPTRPSISTASSASSSGCSGGSYVSWYPSAKTRLGLPRPKPPYSCAILRCL